MSKAQEKRDQQAALVAWNVKARADYAKRELLEAATGAFDEATDLFEAAGATDEPATAREERLVNDAYDKGEQEGAGYAKSEARDIAADFITQKIEWLRYSFPDTTMTTMEILEALRDEVEAA